MTSGFFELHYLSFCLKTTLGNFGRFRLVEGIENEKAFILLDYGWLADFFFFFEIKHTSSC